MSQYAMYMLYLAGVVVVFGVSGLIAAHFERKAARRER